MSKNSNNIEVVQSYIFTTSRYNFSVYEKRILYRIVELLQADLKGEKLRGTIQKDFFHENVDIVMDTDLFKKNANDENDTLVKRAFTSLNKKVIEYSDEKHKWKLVNIIERPKLNISGKVSFRLHTDIYEVFMNFAKGYSKYELLTAMKFESAYTMRLYELLSNQERPITYSIEKFREILNLPKSYKHIGNLKNKVIEVAKQELDEKSPKTFAYQFNKEGRKYVSVTFVTIDNPKNKDERLERKKLQQKESLRWSMSPELEVYLKSTFGFSNKELKNNIDTFKNAQKRFDVLDFITSKKRYLNDSNNPKGYLISSLKKEIEGNSKDANLKYGR